MSRVAATIDKLLAAPAFRKALDYLAADEANTLNELKEMVLVHGEPFKEHEQRCPMYKAKLEQHGAADVSIDTEGNVMGYVHGAKGPRPKVVLEAHLDTVFKASTPLAVTEKDGLLHCPGISDDTAGLATNLSILRAIRHAGLKPVGSLMIGGTVGEEGEGNARGIRALMREHDDIDTVLCIECYDECHICLEALGIKRYEVVFTGPGGHSWSAFGAPNAIHALGRAVAKIADIAPPTNPRTSFSVGVVSGGTTVNSIPDEARMKIDMRSVETAELDRLDATILALIDQAVAEENLRWKTTDRITVAVNTIGSKPAGALGHDAVASEVAVAATKAVSAEPRIVGAASTNQNIPLNMGVPSVVIGAGGKSGNHHRLDEWYNPKNAHKGAQKALIMLFALAGLEGVCDPLAKPCLNRGPVR